LPFDIAASCLIHVTDKQQWKQAAPAIPHRRRPVAALHLPARPSPALRAPVGRRASRHDSAERANRVQGVISSCPLRHAARSQCDVRNRLERGTCCAPVGTCPHTLCVPARADAHAWLQLVQLRRSAPMRQPVRRADAAAGAALHLRRRGLQRCQRSPRLATRLGYARSASSTRYNQLRGASSVAKRAATELV
jgi:hypothetical protein